MSHGLTSKDAMVFTGLTPWHYAETGRDGRAIDIGGKGVSARQAFERADLLWQVEKTPAFILDSFGKPFKIPGQYGLRRADTGEPFATTVGRQFEPYQNADMADFADSLIKAGDVSELGQLYCHTAGSLDGGARVWALMRVGAEVILDRNGQADVRNPYLLIRNAFGVGAKRKLIVALVLERVVCANTEAVALNGALQAITIPHRGDLKGKMEEAAKVLGFAVKQFESYSQWLQKLADTPMSLDEMRVFSLMLLLDKEERADAFTELRTIKADMESREEKTRKLAQKRFTALEHEGALLTDLFLNGAGNRGKTLHDAHAAVTDFVDHRRGNLDRWRKRAGHLGMLQKRFDYALLGDGAQMKARAGRLLTR